MKREYPDSPLVGVGAIIIENGACCWSSADIRRWRENGRSPAACWKWEKPCAKLPCGRRCEETCLSVEPAELLGVYDRVLRDDAGRTLYHYVLVDFLCRRVAGEARAADDADEVGWFTAVEAAALGLAEDTAEVVRMGFEKAKA